MAIFGGITTEINRNQFNEIYEQNIRLENELLFANKCIKTLITFKSFVDFISDKFKNNLNSNEWQKFEKLRKDVEEVLKSKDKSIERTAEIWQKSVSSEELIDIADDNYEKGFVKPCSIYDRFEQELSSSIEKLGRNKIYTNYCSEDTMKTTETLYSDNEMTPKALNKSNITYNRRKQSNNCSQNTDKSVNYLTEEMTDPTTTQVINIEIISNDEIEENNKSEYLSQNVEKFGNTYIYSFISNSLNSIESELSTKGSNNEQNIDIIEINVVSEESRTSDSKDQTNYNLGKQSNNFSQNTRKNDSTEEMTDPTTTQLMNTEIISNDESSLNSIESELPTKCPNNEQNIDIIETNVGSEEQTISGSKDSLSLENVSPNYQSLQSFERELEGPVIVKIKPSDSSTDPNLNPFFKCPINRCDKWMTFDFIPKHSLEIHNQFVVICGQNKCKKVFTSSAKYDEHMTQLHPKDTHFIPDKNASIHKELKENDSNKCDVCGKVFPTFNRMYRHKKFVHNFKPSIECGFPGGGRRFIHPSRLNTNKTTFHSSFDQIFECNQCNKRFNNQFALKFHDREVHSEKLLACDWPGCEYRSNLAGFMITHQAVHIPDRNYVCDWPECGNAYKISDALKKHMKSHTRSESLVCEECGKAFKRTDHLKAHMNGHALDKNRTTTETLYSNNEMTPKALYKSNITYNRKKQSNNCSQNTEKSVNESIKERTDPTNTKKITTKITISNDEIEENNKLEYFSQNPKDFENTNNSMILSESQLSTKSSNNEQNIDLIDTTVGSEEQTINDLNDSNCLEKGPNYPQLTLKFFKRELEGPVIFNLNPSNSSTDPKLNHVFKCPIIECKKWMTIDFIPKHSLEIHNQFVVICDQNKCKKVFTSSAKYEEHMTRHHPKDKQFIPDKSASINKGLKGYGSTNVGKCNICGKVFLNNYRLYRHKRAIHVNPPQSRLKCDFPGCEQEFRYKRILNSHKITVHSLKFECNLCKKVFKREKALKRHKCCVHSENKCDICGKGFRSRAGMLRHTLYFHNKAVHSGNLLACNWPDCQYRSKYRCYMKKHQAVHRPERNHVCDWPECGKTFKSKIYLMEHINTHTNKVLYSCDYPGCSYQTPRTSSLYIHKHINKMHEKKTK